MQGSPFHEISKTRNTGGEGQFLHGWHWALMLVSKMLPRIYKKIFYYWFYVSLGSLECDCYLSLHKSDADF